MKKRWMALLCAALLAVSAGCGKRENPSSGSSAGASSGSASASREPVTIDILAVELPRELDTASARAAMEKLPELTAGSAVGVKSVVVTYGTSYAATAQALDNGGVDLAFLPADLFAEYCADARGILADAGYTLHAAGLAGWNDGSARRETELTAGTVSLLCAAPTEYGKNLASRSTSGTDFSWEELDRARWGVLGEDSTAGYRCAELWVEKNFDGRKLTDLHSVTFYAGWEELLRAAVNGEIDLLPLAPEQREKYGAVWTMDALRTDSAGIRGFGRSREIEEELPAVAETPRLYDWVAAVKPGDDTLQSELFRTVLSDALERAFDGPAERMSAIGAEHYAPVEDGALDVLEQMGQ